MAKKQRRGAKPDKSATVRTAAQERVHLDWTRRHPARASDERALRKARVAMVDRWSHKNAGTVETHDDVAQRRAGAIARLYASGYLNDDELAWSQEIAAAAEQIMAQATVRTASFETRVDRTGRADGAFYEALGAVWSEMAYSRWRAAMGTDAHMLLSIIVQDVGITRAAAAHAMHVRRARRVLTDALAAWARIHRAVREEVTPADLAAAQAGLS